MPPAFHREYPAFKNMTFLNWLFLEVILGFGGSWFTCWIRFQTVLRFSIVLMLIPIRLFTLMPMPFRILFRMRILIRIKICILPQVLHMLENQEGTFLGLLNLLETFSCHRHRFLIMKNIEQLYIWMKWIGIQFRTGRPWLPIRIRQNDVDRPDPNPQHWIHIGLINFFCIPGAHDPVSGPLWRQFPLRDAIQQPCSGPTWSKK